MNGRLIAIVTAALLGPLCASAALIQFSNVQVQGSLTADHAVTTTNDSIEFDFAEGIVEGGGLMPYGTIAITYEALSDSPLTGDVLELSSLVDLAGAGQVVFNEVIEALDGGQPEVIASYNLTLTAASELPLTELIAFDRPSDHVKVKKSVTVFAPLQGDVAGVSEIGQRLIPEPTSLGLLLLGLGLLRRR